MRNEITVGVNSHPINTCCVCVTVVNVKVVFLNEMILNVTFKMVGVILGGTVGQSIARAFLV